MVTEAESKAHNDFIRMLCKEEIEKARKTSTMFKVMLLFTSIIFIPVAVYLNFIVTRFLETEQPIVADILSIIFSVVTLWWAVYFILKATGQKDI